MINSPFCVWRESILSWAVIVCAAGQGKRMGLGENKLFMDLHGKPLLVHTLEQWEDIPEIEHAIIVVRKGEAERVERMLNIHALKRDWQVVVGGEERQDSVYQGLLALQEAHPDHVLIHDGARPFVAEAHIRALMDAANDYPAAILGIPVRDTIKVVSPTGKVQQTPERAALWAAQTPQMFVYESIFHAHEHALKSGIRVTDDAALMEYLDLPVYIVEGSAHNIKLTTPEDVELAEFLLQRRRNQ